MDTYPREIHNLVTDDGREFYEEWLLNLDIKARARIRVRIDRVEDGNFGDVRPVGEGVSELRLDFGPGYRVYFGQVGNQVYLICGGQKNTQEKDIEIAKRLWREHD